MLKTLIKTVKKVMKYSRKSSRTLLSDEAHIKDVKSFACEARKKYRKGRDVTFISFFRTRIERIMFHYLCIFDCMAIVFQIAIVSSFNSLNHIFSRSCAIADIMYWPFMND